MPDKKLTEGTTALDYEGTLKNLTKEYYDTLDLINRLQANNEEKEDVIQYADKEIKRLNAENERLKEEKETLKSLLDSNQERYFKISNLCYKYRNKLKTAKADIKKLTSGKCIYLSDDETTEYCVEGPCPKYKTETQIKAEAYKECIEKVKEEIAEALKSNYKARSERAQSIPIYTEDEFWNYCAGKIDCLRGLDDFCDNLLKELAGDK